MSKKTKNLLDLIPEKNCQWEVTSEGKIDLIIPRFKWRFFRSLACKLGRSEFVKIHCDEVGSKTWNFIDGQRTVAEIGEFLLNDMGDKIQPVYERLSDFIAILARSRFILFKNL